MHNPPFVALGNTLVDHPFVAGQIIKGFRDYRSRFAAITGGARERFVHGEWQAVQTASKSRIMLYDESRAAVVKTVQVSAVTHADWPVIKQCFSGALEGKADAALAGTFYNSIYRALSNETVPDDVNAFVNSDPGFVAEPGIALTSRYSGTIKEIIRRVLSECELTPYLANLEVDVDRVVTRLRKDIPLLRDADGVLLELVSVTFYRNKGAYLIGRLVVDGHFFPLSIAFRRDTEGVVVDSVLWGEARLSVIFSFTRSYFMVAIDQPVAVVSYLQTILPGKKKWELYTSIGFYKHGKTEFFRGFRQHLDRSDDLFCISEGIKGQVMMAFTLDSYQTVFKVIKDKFPATKSVTREGVRAAYHLVKTHDRVGRMADTQEFQFFELPRDRFDPDLLDELSRVASASVNLETDVVVFKHLYTERLMMPLNIYIAQCSSFQLEQVLEDYGNAIKELAAANIFPGDMLLKNFGVTRHGRVIFYDYDEICYLTDINFRKLPESNNANAHGADPWFEVGEFDVFPEEFATFLFPDDVRKAIFSQHHEDLFTVEGWTTIQEQIRANQLSDVYPYPARDRLR